MFKLEEQVKDFFCSCDIELVFIVCVTCVANVIAARSDVFSAMFEHEMEERKHVSTWVVCV